MKRVLFVLTFAVLLVTSVLAGCETGSVQTVDASDAQLVSREDTLLYKGVPFTGIVYKLNAQGDTLLSVSYRNGLLHGTAREWYSKNSPKSVRYFENGMHEGTHTGWWPNGNRRFQSTYRNDLLQDSSIEWRASGQVYHLAHYTDGHESGMQTEWNADGSVFANYEVRDGRKYGLTGERHCINPWKKSDAK